MLQGGPVSGMCSICALYSWPTPLLSLSPARSHSGSYSATNKQKKTFSGEKEK